MKKFLATILMVAGGILSIWAGSSLLITGQRIYGYDALYVGLVGIGCLSYGVITRSE